MPLPRGSFRCGRELYCIECGGPMYWQKAGLRLICECGVEALAEDKATDESWIYRMIWFRADIPDEEGPDGQS